MRYIRSERSFSQYQPKKSHWSWNGLFSRGRKKIVSRDLPNHALQAPRPRPITSRLSTLRRYAPYILPILILLWLGALVYMPYFKINKVSVTGSTILEPKQLEQEIQENFFVGTLWPRNNYFLLHESTVAEFLGRRYTFNNLEIKKIFPHQLTIYITEKTPVLIYDNGEGYYLVDDAGVAFQRLASVPPSEFKLLPVLNVSEMEASSTIQQNNAVDLATSSLKKQHLPDYNSLFVRYGRFPVVYITGAGVSTTLGGTLSRVVLKPDVVLGISTFFKRLEEGRVVQPNYVVMGNPLAGATLYTNQSWQILFQPLFDIDDQITKFKTIIKMNHPTNYVDLRFGSRVYWK
ncbi:MAG: hypothetical protein EXS55_02185 [Candidatus Magasanikbacteria bacterium]|nr:hypothetical protein [Candidatus Magasanikbacteria bacterium]